jgi:hypothetical protein
LLLLLLINAIGACARRRVVVVVVAIIAIVAGHHAHEANILAHGYGRLTGRLERSRVTRLMSWMSMRLVVHDDATSTDHWRSNGQLIVVTVRFEFVYAFAWCVNSPTPSDCFFLVFIAGIFKFSLQ